MGLLLRGERAAEMGGGYALEDGCDEAAMGNCEVSECDFEIGYERTALEM